MVVETVEASSLEHRTKCHCVLLFAASAYAPFLKSVHYCRIEGTLW